MDEFKPFEMIMLMEYGSAVADGDARQVCIKARPIAELVRCKDCKFYCRNETNICALHGFRHLDDWFCADGERREEP